MQEQGWARIAAGEHALLLAPTGSGKTLAAFLWCIDRLSRAPRPEAPRGRPRPLRLAAEGARLRHRAQPARAARRGCGAPRRSLGLAVRVPRVAVRTGDTPARERSASRRAIPAEILVTTPESLYLILGSAQRETLRSVETVIVDEIHALAPTKRGAHLALSLERVAALARAAIRSASASPRRRDRSPRSRASSAATARSRSSTRARGPRLDLEIRVPVPDMTRPVAPAAPRPRADARRGSLGLAARRARGARAPGPRARAVAGDRAGAARGGARAPLDDRVREQPRPLRAALPAPQRAGGRGDRARAPRQPRARAAPRDRGGAQGGAHARHRRDQLASSSGIDMGAVDLVLLVESPGAVVARAAARRARGPPAWARCRRRASTRSTAATCSRRPSSAAAWRRAPSRRCACRAIRSTCWRSRSSRCAPSSPGASPSSSACVRRAANFRELSREVLVAVLDMLAGRYPSTDFAELRPRLVWDREADVLRAARGAGKLALALRRHDPRPRPLPRARRRRRPARRRARRGDGLRDARRARRSRSAPRPGASSRSRAIACSWRRRRARWAGCPSGAATGRAGRSSSAARSAPSCASSASARATRPRRGCARRSASTPSRPRNLLDYLAGAARRDRHAARPTARSRSSASATSSATGASASSRRSARACTRPGRSRIEAQPLRGEAGFEVQALWSDDGIVLRFADADAPAGPRGCCCPSPRSVEDLVVEQLGHSALFAAQFRENAARALLLPRRRPGRAHAALRAAPARRRTCSPSRASSRASRSCSRPTGAACRTSSTCRASSSCCARIRAPRGARGRGRDAGGLAVRALPRVRLHRRLPLPGRHARGRAPRAGAHARPRRCCATCSAQEQLRDLLDARAIDEVEDELQGLADRGRARAHPDALADLLRRVGDLGDAELAARCAKAIRRRGSRSSRRRAAIARGADRRRGALDRRRGRRRSTATRSACVPPAGLARGAARARARAAGAAPAALRAHATGPSRAAAARAALRAPRVAGRGGARRPRARGRLLAGEFHPGGREREWCDPEVLRRIRRRTLARLRGEVAPVDARDARALPAPPGTAIGAAPAARARLDEALAQLEGAARCPSRTSSA